MNSGARQGGAVHSPVIDGRDLDALVRQMKAMVPHYTPEWRFSPDDPDAGTALFYLAADMLRENIKRLNRVPLNNFIAFLDLLRVKIQPARPSRTHVVFTLNEGVREPVYIPAGTLLTADPQDGGDSVPFETETALLVTPAELTALYNVHPDRDRIVLAAEQPEEMLSSGALSEVPLFSVEGDNLQAHVLYIRSDDLFAMTHPARITLTWHNAERRYVEEELAAVFGRADWLEWSYSRGTEWIPFEKVTRNGQEITLWKQSMGEIEYAEVDGIAGRWIRCMVKPTAAAENGSPALQAIPEMDRVTMRASHDTKRDPAGIPPMELYFNDMELNREAFYPFGEHFLPYSVFYISSTEVFTKKGSRLSLTFEAKTVANTLRTGPDPEIKWKMVMRTADFEQKPPPRLFIRRVQWEYWNGDNWMRLPDSDPFEEIFADMSETSKVYSLEFPCPENMAQTLVNGRDNYWLRVRVLATDPVTAPLVEYMSPQLSSMAFSYAYGSAAARKPDSGIAVNNAESRDVTSYVRQGGGTFRPFLSVPSPSPAVYLAFDAPPDKGPIRFHFGLGRMAAPEDKQIRVEWEAYVKKGTEWSWVTLKTVDDTFGFTQSGTLQFAGPPGLAPATMFSKESVWLRALNRDGRYGEVGKITPALSAIHRNAVVAVQQLTIVHEFPERSREGYALSRTPIIGQEIWIDETDALGEHELIRLMDIDPERYEVYRDSEGHLQRVWVRWSEVQNLAESAADDRHYTIDSATGVIAFGNGVRGRALPREGGDKIRVTYRITEGNRGNVDSGQISSIMQSIAFVNGVTNPAPAVGGGDAETLDSALRRGPQQLKHRGRAISAADVEWIVREAEPGILKVKCLSNRNARLERTPGSVAVVVLPSGGLAGTAHFPVTKRKLEEALRQRAANLIAATGRLAIMAPAFLEVSVIATLVVDSPDRMLPAEAACLERLARFLDPLEGQTDGQGWEIGEPVHASAFYGLLQSVRGVQRVEQLHLNVVRTENGESVEILPDDMRHMLHGIVTDGKNHRLTVVIA